MWMPWYTRKNHTTLLSSPQPHVRPAGFPWMKHECSNMPCHIRVVSMSVQAVPNVDVAVTATGNTKCCFKKIDFPVTLSTRINWSKMIWSNIENISEFSCLMSLNLKQRLMISGRRWDAAGAQWWRGAEVANAGRDFPFDADAGPLVISALGCATWFSVC